MQSKKDLHKQGPSPAFVILPRDLQVAILRKQLLLYVLPSVPHTGA